MAWKRHHPSLCLFQLIIRSKTIDLFWASKKKVTASNAQWDVSTLLKLEIGKTCLLFFRPLMVSPPWWIAVHATGYSNTKLEYVKVQYKFNSLLRNLNEKKSYPNIKNSFYVNKITIIFSQFVFQCVWS